MTINTTSDFLDAVRAGLLECVGHGSEQGYVAKAYYPEGRYCGVVRRGHRAGLHKYQGAGKGGPHGNSSQYISNSYYREV